MKNRMPKMPKMNGGLPKPIADAIEGLREKRLLPVAIALVVAIIAVPIVLSSGSEAPSPKAEDADAAAQTAFELAPENQPVVLAKDEGVRDYKQRLSDAAAKNPFIQQFVAPEGGGEGSDAAAGSSSDSATSSGSVSVTLPTGGGKGTKDKGSKNKGSGGGSGSAGSAPGATAKPETQTVSYTIDAYAGPASNMQLREDIAPLTFLPNDQNPSVVFMGVSNDHKRALFTVARSVFGVTGDGICLLSSCDLLSLTPGKTATFVLSADGTLLYSVKLVRIERVVTKATEEGE